MLTHSRFRMFHPKPSGRDQPSCGNNIVQSIFHNGLSGGYPCSMPPPPFSCTPSNWPAAWLGEALGEVRGRRSLWESLFQRSNKLVSFFHVLSVCSWISAGFRTLQEQSLFREDGHRQDGHPHPHRATGRWSGRPMTEAMTRCIAMSPSWSG